MLEPLCTRLVHNNNPECGLVSLMLLIVISLGGPAFLGVRGGSILLSRHGGLLSLGSHSRHYLHLKEEQMVVEILFRGDPRPGLGTCVVHWKNEGLGVMFGLCFPDLPPGLWFWTQCWLQHLNTGVGKATVNLMRGTVYLALRLEENTDSHIKSETEINSE